MEQAVVTAVTHDASEAKVTVMGVPDRPGLAARLFRGLADRHVNVDMIVQNTSVHGTTDISFTVPDYDLPRQYRGLRGPGTRARCHRRDADADVARVSLVGAGMKSTPGVTALTFETLANNGINIEMISTSTIRISCVIRAKAAETAVRALHEAFELG